MQVLHFENSAYAVNYNIQDRGKNFGTLGQQRNTTLHGRDDKYGRVTCFRIRELRTSIM